MNVDIRISTTFRNHRKRNRLRRLLGDRSTDHLIDFWIGVAQHRPTGELAGWDEFDIADEAGWAGDPEKFVNAMVCAGFIEKHGDVFYCHDWEKWQSWVIGAPERSEKAKKAAAARWGK